MRKSTSTCATLAFAVGKDMGVNFRKHTFEVPGSHEVEKCDVNKDKGLRKKVYAVQNSRQITKQVSASSNNAFKNCNRLKNDEISNDSEVKPLFYNHNVDRKLAVWRKHLQPKQTNLVCVNECDSSLIVILYKWATYSYPIIN